MTKYEIKKVISRGKGTSEVTVEWDGKSVTRHLVGDKGFHPDDGIPGVHRRLEEKISQLVQEIAHKKEAIHLLEKAEKKVKNWKDLIVLMQAEILLLEHLKVQVEEELRILRTNDPVIVTYY